MKRRFVIAVNPINASEEKAIQKWFSDYKYEWWHWIEGIWLITEDRNIHSSNDIRDQLHKLASDASILVLPQDGLSRWSGLGSKINTQDMFQWLRNKWRDEESPETIESEGTLLSSSGDQEIQPIIRSIEFPPEYRQAGIGIMVYFSQVLEQKYPNISASVRIIQEQKTVSMIIETAEGNREIIEQTLEEYALVIAGKKQLSEFLPSPVDTFRLENQLALTQVQLETERRMLLLTENQYESRIQSLSDEVENLRNLIGNSLQALQREQHISVNVMAEQHHADRLVGVLDTQDFAPLHHLVERGFTEADEIEVKRILTEAGQQNPRLLQRLAEQITSGIFSSSNTAKIRPWLQEVANNLSVLIRLIS